nr:D-2-hydroxyacid dehydrogenase [Pyrolobus fumarii]
MTRLDGMKVLVTDPVDKLLLGILEKHGLQVDYRPGVPREELLKIIGDYDILVVRSRTKVDREVIDRGEKLKVIARAGVGLDNIDVQHAIEKGIKVVNAPGAAAQSVAELTIGLLIAAARFFKAHIVSLERREWSKGRWTGVELSGKTLGVIGFGRIGYRVAKIARGLGMRVLAYDVVDASDRAREIGAEFTRDLDVVLRESDAITLHVPLTKETYHLIDRDALEKMKDGVIIVNTSRGPVIDTKALLEYLESGKVFAAALDVLEHEPPKEEWEWRLVHHPRVIVTPHIGAETREAKRRVAEETAYAILEALGMR